MLLKEEVFFEDENLQDYQRRRKEKKVRNCKEKALHAEVFRQTSDVAGEESWRWLSNVFFLRRKQKA